MGVVSKQIDWKRFIILQIYNLKKSIIMHQANNQNSVNVYHIKRKLTQRFSYDKIINEEFYIKNMSPNMTMSVSKLVQDQLFKNCSLKSSLQLISQVPFFKLSGQKTVKIQYENQNRILIITGIRKQIVKDWVQQWIKEYNKRNNIIKEINLPYWSFIEFNNDQLAYLAKKFIRVKKAETDQIQNQRKLLKKQRENQVSYKYPNRRVRIVLLSQDFFTILFDMINQSNYQKFSQAVDGKNELHLYKKLVYLPLYKSQKIQEKIEQLDDAVSSQFLSHTSSAYDHSSRIGQIDVQTSNQGTQMQTIGVGVGNEEYIEQKPNIIKKCEQNQQIKIEAQKIIKIQQKVQIQEKENDKAKLERIIIKGKQQKDSPKVQAKNSYKLWGNDNEKHNLNKKQKKFHNYSAQPKLTLRKTLTSDQFPSLYHKKAEKKTSQSIQQNSLIHSSYIEMKKKYNQFVKQSHGLVIPEPVIPDYIRRQSESVIYKKKFYHEVVRKAKQIVTNRRTDLQ